MWKRILGNLLLLLLAVGFAAAAAEAVLQLVYSPPLLSRKVTEFDPVLGWKLVPGTYPVDRKESERFRGFDIYVNQLSMRNAEVELLPRAGVRRLLLLGDSFTFGMLIAPEDLMAAQAERALAGSPVAPVEVVNSGTQGWGTAHQLLYERELRAAGFAADVHLLMFFPNDLLDNLAVDYEEMEPIVFAPRFALDGSGALYLASPPQRPSELRPGEEPAVPGEEGARLERGSRAIAASHRLAGFRPLLPRFVKTRAIGFLETRPGLVRLAQKIGLDVRLPRLPSIIRGWYDDDVLGRGWPLTEALLLALRDEVEGDGARFAVAAIPSPFQVYRSYDVLIERNYADDPLARSYLSDRMRPQRMLRDVCVREGIPYLDLAETFASHASGSSLYSPADHHLSVGGHAVAGEAIARFFESILAEGR